MKGRLLDADGEPITLGRMMSPDTASYFIDINRSGEFDVEVLQGARYTLGYTKHENNSYSAIENGVPHLVYLGKYRADSDPTDLGDIQLPPGYLVDVLVTDWDGSAVPDAQVQFKHIRNQSSFGSLELPTNEDGLVQIPGADFTGFEMGENCEIVVTPPEDEDRFVDKEYTESLNVDGPRTVEISLDPTDPVTTTTTSTTTTSTETISSPQETQTESAATTSSSTPSSGNISSNTGSISSPEVRRGFFSNGGPSDDFEFLSDPFVLTVGGFLLSVAGIAQNLLRGN